MSDRINVTDLLAAALAEAADVARTRLEREVTVAPGRPPSSNAILRFDLSFPNGGRLSWYVCNEDATGFSDLLVGGAGDRAAVLTEVHLDALTAAFSDMLSRAVDAISAGLDVTLQAGDLDLGMETTLPEHEPGGASLVLALEVERFGTISVVQHVDAALAEFVERHASAVADADATAAPDNVVQLPAPSESRAAQAPQRSGDLEMLMNVPLPITVELGQTQRTIRELTDFTVGSIIELGKLAGDPLDIKVNDRIIARGEVVVIDEEFGIRVTEIVSPEDRLAGLG